MMNSHLSTVAFRIRFPLMVVLAVCLTFPATVTSQTSDEDKQIEMLTLSEFRPESKLQAKSTLLERAKFPVFDIHTHFGFRLKGDRDALKRFVDVMDRHQIAVCNSLDAKLGQETAHCQYLLKDYPNRFTVFAHIDFQGTGNKEKPETWACNQPGFVRTCCEQLKRAKSNGVVGLKFFKSFGLGYKNADGSLIKIDDPRFDPIWATCGELRFPVIIHTGDPAAFFDPIDEKNERYEELARHPDWSFHGPAFPSRQALLDARNRVIKKHPKTIFIGAHCAGNPENLSAVGAWLDLYPNLYVEFASRIAELGRQPYTARKFIVQYQDRILFGTDGPWPELRLTFYWRFLETYDENFPYSEKVPPPQGLWNIHGIGLDDSILRKVYSQNALKILLPSAGATFESGVKELSK